MICPQCGEMNPPEAEQCTSCGANLPPSSKMIVCEGCGRENPITNRFCQGCGRLLSRPEVAFHREVMEPGVEVKEEPGRGLPLTYILLVVLLVLAALTLLVYFMSR